MTSDLDIWRSAQALVKQHGPDAPIHAAMRADELLEAGDLDGVAVWKRIVKAVGKLLSKERPAGLRFNSPKASFPFPWWPLVEQPPKEKVQQNARGPLSTPRISSKNSPLDLAR